MELFLRYLKSRRRLFYYLMILYLIFAVSFLLYRLPFGAVLYPALLSLCVSIMMCLYDFSCVKREHEMLEHIQSMVDVTVQNFPVTSGILDKDYQEIIRRISREHSTYRCDTLRSYTDMIEYYTVWAHQIKTPIASMRLHLQNEDSSFSRRISSDLRRIEQYVEMVLTFLRLNSDSTDYVFKEYDLDRLVRCAVKKFSSDFIERKLSLVYEPMDVKVVTDEKWFSFVIEQVISNALKYTSSGSITISMVGEKTLRIRDTGIGIAPEDLPRIFENGYTGYNGRTDQRASGIGLYLCRRICSNLGHKITAVSAVDEGTAIDIDLTQTRIEAE